MLILDLKKCGQRFRKTLRIKEEMIGSMHLGLDGKLLHLGHGSSWPFRIE